MNVTVFIGHFGNSFFSPVKFDPCQSVNYSNEANIGIQKSANEFSRFECEKNDNVKGVLIDIRPNLWICMTKKWKRKSPDLHVNSSLSEVCNLYSIFFSAQRGQKEYNEVQSNFETYGSMRKAISLERNLLFPHRFAIFFAYLSKPAKRSTSIM